MKLSEKIVRSAQHRGAPQQVSILSDEDIQRYLAPIQFEKGGFKVAADVKQQLGDIAKTREDPIKGNYVYVISSELSAMRAQQLALEIFYQAIDDYNHRPPESSGDLPYWHTVFGGFTDKLRDQPPLAVGHPTLLVIDGLAVNATDIKVEKARDLLVKFQDVPRVVITCGINPLQFAYERLYYPVNRVAYFGAAKHTTI